MLITDRFGAHIYPESFTDCLGFLTRPKYHGYIGWWYNINYDIEAILKWLDEQTMREFAKRGEGDFIYEKDTVKIKFVSGKFALFSIKKREYVYYDLAGFLPGGLDFNAQKYIGKGKKSIDLYLPEASLEQMLSPEVLAYCKQDSAITGELADYFTSACNKNGIYTKNYSSPASLATSYFTSHCDIPTLQSITKYKYTRAKLAYEAYKGGFVSTFKRGYFPKVYVYDINSAYPYQMTKLPDYRKGTMLMRIGDIPKDAYHGWLRCNIDVPDDLYGPGYYNPVAVYLKKFNKNFYFSGKIQATITLLEYNALKPYYKIEPLQGIYWIPDELSFVFRDPVTSLYQKRLANLDNASMQVVLKLVLNGFYGKSIQKIPQGDGGYSTGNLFNPFYASYITAGARIQIFETLVKYVHPEHLISIMTDSVTMTEPSIPTSPGKVLGEYTLEMEGEGLFIGSGLYTLRTPNRTKTATRGFKFNKKIDFIELCNANKKSKYIEMPQNYRLTYKESLRIKKFINWNIIDTKLKKIDINTDNKRQWAREFENCEDILSCNIDSKPINVNMRG